MRKTIPILISLAIIAMLYGLVLAYMNRNTPTHEYPITPNGENISGGYAPINNYEGKG